MLGSAGQVPYGYPSQNLVSQRDPSQQQNPRTADEALSNLAGVVGELKNRETQMGEVALGLQYVVEAVATKYQQQPMPPQAVDLLDRFAAVARSRMYA